MICINCYQASTSVTNSRPHKKQASVWRRRHCSSCNSTFTTTETPLVNKSLQVIYTSGETVPFSLLRLTVNLYSFLAHRDKEVADEAYWLSDTVYHLFMKRGNGGQAIPLYELITTVHEVLARFDALAGLQYAAKYKLVTNIRKSPGRPRLSGRA